MEKLVSSLYDRLSADPNAQLKLIGIMDGAINEMHNCGIFSSLSEELQKKVHSSDPHERITVKTAIAKSVAYQEFILASNPIMLKNGDIAHMIAVKYNPRFKNSIAICIQGGLEGMYLAGVYKNCTDGIMQYYIQTDAKGEDYSTFRRLMLDVESLYDNFQINFMPYSGNSPQTAEKQNVSAPTAKTEGSTEKTEGTEKRKTGFFRKLFGKK